MSKIIILCQPFVFRTLRRIVIVMCQFEDIKSFKMKSLNAENFSTVIKRVILKQNQKFLGLMPIWSFLPNRS